MRISKLKRASLLLLPLLLMLVAGAAFLQSQPSAKSAQTGKSMGMAGPAGLTSGSLSGVVAQQQGKAILTSLDKPSYGLSSKHDTSPALRSIPPAQVKPRTENADHENFTLSKNGSTRVTDSVVQRYLAGKANAPAPAIPAPFKSFEGVKALAGVAPPDTNGEVGPNHYVQITNAGFQIFDKTGTSIYGPVPNQTLFYNFGGECEFENDGDPIVVYDQIADRWLISQFAIGPERDPNNPNGFHECIAISTSGDPTGAYYRYDFFMSSTLFFDYPQIGLWPEAYYASFNTFDAASGNFVAGALVAFDRAQMLAGHQAGVQIMLDPAGGGYLPSDLNGQTLPPPGAPNLFAEPNDNATGEIRAFNVHVDWNDPSQSTYTGPFSLMVAPWTVPCDYSRDCVPQPGTTQKLDTVSDRFMRSMNYRNFGDHQSWVTNHTVDTSAVTTTIQLAPRWYEFRATDTFTPTVFQQGSYSPDPTNRWMGSVIMNKFGDMALGYSVADTSTFPGIRYTGRLVTDTLGTMPQGEGLIVNGSGSQSGNNLNRWGDYSNISVDPRDDCTFWYTQEYIQITGSFNWQTRVGAFRFGNCTGAAVATGTPGTPAATVTPNPSATSMLATTTPIPGCDMSSVSGAINSADGGNRLASRYRPSFFASRCDIPRTFPAPLPGTPRYDSYTYYNPSAAPACVTIRLTSPCNNYDGSRLFSAAYTGTVNPADISQNWLGDMGGYSQNNNEYQVTVPARTSFSVVVSEYVPDTGCPNYTLSVSCGIVGGTPTVTSTAVASTPTVQPQPTTTACAIMFADVPTTGPGSTFYTFIRCLACRGIIGGYPCGATGEPCNSTNDPYFRPTVDVTRGQISKMVVLAAGLGGPMPAQIFEDVLPSNTFYDVIQQLASRGYIGGYPCGQIEAEPCITPGNRPYFRPSTPTTRGQLTKIVSNTAQYTDDPGAQRFTDVPTDSPFYVWVNRLASRSIIGGYPCGEAGEPCDAQNRPYFRPNTNVSRGQTSKIVANTFFPNCQDRPGPTATSTSTPAPVATIPDPTTGPVLSNP